MAVGILIFGSPAFYLLSFGPACDLCDKGFVSGYALWAFYRPLARVYCSLPISTRNEFMDWINNFRTPRNNFYETPEPLWREWESQHRD